MLHACILEPLIWSVENNDRFLRLIQTMSHPNWVIQTVTFPFVYLCMNEKALHWGYLHKNIEDFIGLWNITVNSRTVQHRECLLAYGQTLLLPF